MNGNPGIAKVLGYDGSTAETHAAFGPIIKFMIILGIGLNLSIALSYVLWNNFWAHTAFVCILFLFCTWNGAMRYFNMMTKYYVKSLKKMTAIEGSAQPDDETIPKNINEGGEKDDSFKRV